MTSGLALIVAIGAQNAFVLRQGLRREHVAAVVALCITADALLIVAGVSGMGALVSRHPAVLSTVRMAGAAFLLAYAALALRRAVAGSSLQADGDAAGSTLAAALATAAALTFLNPHVYLDTVVLLGSIGAQQAADSRPGFAAGAIVASTLWFGGLGFGARLAAPVFARPRAWRILDTLIAAVMATLAVILVLGR